MTMKKIILLFFLLISNYSLSKEIIINDSANLLNKQETKQILVIINKVFNLFKIKNIKNDLRIRIKKGNHHDSLYRIENKELILNIGNQLHPEVFSHELTHYIILNYYKNNTILNNHILEEALPDLISLEFKQPNSYCEEKFNRLNYKFSYKDSPKFFNPYFYIKEAQSCCSNIKYEKDLFCINLKEKEMWYSHEYLAKNNKEINYPLNKDLTSSHYIGLPLLQYIVEYNSKHNKNVNYFITKLIKNNKMNLHDFIKNNLYDKELFKKYEISLLKKTYLIVSVSPLITSIILT